MTDVFFFWFLEKILLLEKVFKRPRRNQLMMGFGKTIVGDGLFSVCWCLFWTIVSRLRLMKEGINA